MITLSTIEALRDFRNTNDFCILVLSTHTCSVCSPVKMKLEKLCEEYPGIALGEVYIEDVELAKGEFTVFTVPTVILFGQGKELSRHSRFIQFDVLGREIDRYYEIFYGEQK